jgi:hypothetical protein
MRPDRRRAGRSVRRRRRPASFQSKPLPEDPLEEASPSVGVDDRGDGRPDRRARRRVIGGCDARGRARIGVLWRCRRSTASARSRSAGAPSSAERGDLGKSSVTSAKVKSGSLLAADFKADGPSTRSSPRSRSTMSRTSTARSRLRSASAGARTGAHRRAEDDAVRSCGELRQPRPADPRARIAQSSCAARRSAPRAR